MSKELLGLGDRTANSCVLQTREYILPTGCGEAALLEPAGLFQSVLCL